MLKRISFVLAFVLAMFCAETAQAGVQSLSLGGGVTGNFTVPQAAPYASLGSFRVEFRLHNVNVPSGTCRSIVALPSFPISVCGPNVLGTASAIQMQDDADTFSGYDFYVAMNLQGGTGDVLVRFQRDTVAKQITGEIWNIDGTGYAQSVSVINTVKPIFLPQGATLGDTGFQVAFLRWYSTALPIGTALDLSPPPQPAAGGNLGDWELDGSGNDSSGNGLNLTFTGGSPAYVSTPLYGPVCNGGSQRAFRAGAPATLDGSLSYPLDGGTSLKYVWRQMPGVSPVPVQWMSSNTVMQPVIEGLIFGSYNFTLTVTDSSGGSATCTVHHGAVATDEKGVVITGNPLLDNIFGSQIRWGANPWPYYDDRHKYLSDYFGGLQASNPDVWSVALNGTINEVNGSSTIAGTGTTFTSTFACNGSDYIVMNFPHTPPGGVSTTHRFRALVLSCPSDTQMTIDRVWPLPSQTGMTYAKMTAAQVFYWFGNSTNTNFYDNVLGFYSLYYRSGIDTYLNFARTLADRWWTMDQINQGYICDGIGQIPCPFPRDRSFTGLVVRALDGRPDMWPGLRELFNSDLNISLPIYNAQALIYDLREYSYILNEVSLCALADPDPTQRSNCQAGLVSAIHATWIPQQTKDGVWLNSSNGLSSWNGDPGTVSVTKNSTTVTGTGTIFTAGCAGQQFWSESGINEPVTSSVGDATSYQVVSVQSDTSMTITPAYSGSTQSGRGWQCNNLVGIGIQPFMVGGVAGRMFSNMYHALSSQPVEAAHAQTFSIDAWRWMSIKGYWGQIRGLFYGRVFPGCEPNPSLNMFCAGTDPTQSAETNIQVARFLGAETLNGCARSYMFSGSGTTKSVCDSLYGGLYGGLGGPEADSHYAWQLLGRWGTSFTATYSIAKNYGFSFGWGGGSAWPAASMGGVSPALLRTAWIGFKLAEVPGSSQYRVTLTDPTGKSSMVVCTTTPCGVMVDMRLGDHLYHADYLNSSGGVMAHTDTLLVPVR